MKQTEEKNCYFLLSREGEMLARGELIGSQDSPELQIRVLDEGSEKVLAQKEIQLIGISDSAKSMVGRVLRGRNDWVAVERVQSLGVGARQNLRVPVCVDTFLYPLTGAWAGRRGVTTKDLSCGGAAFYCVEQLEPGERAELVVPSTENPLVLKCEILRQLPSEEERPLYAARFVDLCADEERLVRESVFNIQIHQRTSAFRRPMT